MAYDPAIINASAFLTHKAIGIRAPKEGIAGFIVTAVFAGEVCEERFPGLQGCHCDHLLGVRRSKARNPQADVPKKYSDPCFVSDGPSDYGFRRSL